MSRSVFAGIPLAIGTADQAVARVLQAGRSREATSFRFVNAGTLHAAAASPEYRCLLRAEGFNFPDGKPLALVLRLSRGNRHVSCDQVRGPWLFETCLDRGRSAQLRHFFLGTTDETLDQLVSVVSNRFPGVQVVGTYAPPFGPRDETERDSADRLVAQSGADLVWVALGTPKQDLEAWRLTSATGVPTAAVGAAFDFTAGTKPTSPALFRKMGLEWLHRLATEPRRLWRRYLFGNARFVLLTVKHFWDRA